MRYICLHYRDENRWDAMSGPQRKALREEWLAYDDLLRRSGHLVGAGVLQDRADATTLRCENGRVSITDGPCAGTKEQLGGILLLEAIDLNQAIRLMSTHPGVRHAGPCEIRPAAGELVPAIVAPAPAAKAGAAAPRPWPTAFYRSTNQEQKTSTERKS